MSLLLVSNTARLQTFHLSFFGIQTEPANLPNFSAKLKKNCGCLTVTYPSIAQANSQNGQINEVEQLLAWAILRWVTIWYQYFFFTLAN